jgi:hypothetical protein
VRALVSCLNKNFGLQLELFPSLERGVMTHEKDKVECRYLVIGRSHTIPTRLILLNLVSRPGRHPVGGSPRGWQN